MQNLYFFKILKDGVLYDIQTWIITRGYSDEEFESVINYNWNVADSLDEFVQFMLDDGHMLAPSHTKNARCLL